MDNSNNRDANPYVQRVNAPDGGADALRENYTENYAGVGCNDLGCDNNSDMSGKKPHRMGVKKGFGVGIGNRYRNDSCAWVYSALCIHNDYRQERAYRCKECECA